VSGRPADDRGQITAFVVIFASAVILFAGLVLDGGLALAAKTRALGEAQEAARAGAQALDLAAYRKSGAVRLVPAQARALAERYLASTGDTGSVIATAQAVTVTVTARQHTQLLGVAGLHVLTATSTATAHPVRGVDAPEP